MYYRSNYRPKKKSRGSKKVITVIAAVIIVITATIFLGNYLKGKAEYSKENSTTVPPEVTVSEDELSIIAAAPQVSAYPVFLEDMTLESAYLLAEELAATGYTGVSLRLTDGSGRPTYSSDTTEMFNSERARAGEDDDHSVPLTALKDITAAFHSAGLRTVGCFTTWNYNADSASDEVLRSYEIALVCELPTLGIDEIVIFGLETDGDNRTASLEYIEKINSLISDSTLGVAIKLSSVKEAGTDLQILISKFDFLSVILDIPEETDKVYGAVESQINESTVVLTKHSPRLVLPYVDNTITVEEILAINGTHIDNWMIY